MSWNALIPAYTVSLGSCVYEVKAWITEHAVPVLVPQPHDPHPGRLVRHLDFNHFRTIGMRRSVEEGVNNRFVTGDRLVAVLKVRPSFLPSPFPSESG